MAEPRHYRAIFQLLVPQAEARISEPATNTAERVLLLDLARQEKSLPNLLQAWEQAGGLEPAERAELGSLRAKHEGSKNVAKSLPATALMLKGESMQRYYPPGVPRFTTDIDVLVESFHEIPAVHQSMRSIGYLIDGSGMWSLRVEPPSFSGIGSIRYWTSDRDEGAVSVEVQIGGFPSSLTQVLPYRVLADSAEALPGLHCRGLSPTAQLALILTDYSIRRGPITLRHLADLVHLHASAGDRIDYLALTQLVEDRCLACGLARLAESVRARGLSDLVPAKLGQLLEDLRRRRVPTAGPRLTLAQRCAVSAQRRLELAPAKWKLWQWTSRSRPVMLALATQTRVYGIPIAAKAVAVPALLLIDRRLFLACGAGVFLLSLTGAVPESFRRAMFDLVRKEARPTIIGRMEAPR